MSCVTFSLLHKAPNAQSSGTDKVSSIKSKGKPVDPTEHPNGGGNADEADKDEEKEDATPINEENDVKPPDPPTSSKAKKTFGMHRAEPTARGTDPSNCEDRFPKDPIYEETMPNARVWMTHQAESAIHDANTVEEIRDIVDVLLVFVSASLLFELLLVQRALANGSPVETIPISSLNPQTAFVPAATDVWVNALWFTSLFLSLTTALKWREEVIVGVLPVLMHLALASFFIGLSLFLHPLRAALPWVIWTGTVLLIVAYVIVTILPMCFPQCAYRTPLCDLVYASYIYAASLFKKHSQIVSGCNHITAKPNSLKKLELEAVEKVSLRLSVEALQWLLSTSSNPAVQSIAVESMGGLPMAARVELQDILHGINYDDGFSGSLPTGTILSITERKFERLLRSDMFIPGEQPLWINVDIPDQAGRDEFGANLVIQIPKLYHFRYSDLGELGVFLRDILSLETPTRFPPIVWTNLIHATTTSRNLNLFSIDQFPVLLCSAVTDSIVGTNNPKQHLFASPLVVEFHHAAGYFPEVTLEYMMRWLLPFDLLPGERLRLSQLAEDTDIPGPLKARYCVHSSCLKFLAKQPVSSSSASLLEAYDIGIATSIHPFHSDPTEKQTILRAIDYLHEPENLFPDQWNKWPLRMSGIPDIMTALVQIRPLDPAWDTCRQRLRELAKAQGFSVVTGGKNQIGEQKCHIRKGIKTLDKLFSDIPPQATASLELVHFSPTFLSLDVAEESLARVTAVTSVSVACLLGVDGDNRMRNTNRRKSSRCISPIPLSKLVNDLNLTSWRSESVF
ncbi:hypothetical protein IW262DRAFT_1301730 [Armillaria fumosa]|nr:hypothetical protein IW262DRAFT_1301730 [Armillaria fumosa]